MYTDILVKDVENKLEITYVIRKEVKGIMGCETSVILIILSSELF